MVNSYIVRIYREEKNNPRAFVGVVEDVEKQGKRAFTNLDELWEILKPGAGREGGEKRRSKEVMQGASTASRGRKKKGGS